MDRLRVGIESTALRANVEGFHIADIKLNNIGSMEVLAIQKFFSGVNKCYSFTSTISSC